MANAKKVVLFRAETSQAQQEEVGDAKSSTQRKHLRYDAWTRPRGRPLVPP